MQTVAIGKTHRSLRILIVVEPGIDGAFRHVEGLVKFLLENGQQVYLAYSDRRGSKELSRLVELVEEKGKTLNLRVSNQPSLGDLPAQFRLWHFARQVRPDIVHGHSSKAGVLARCLYLFGFKATYFYTPHAYYGLARCSAGFTRLYNGIENVLARIGTTINISPDEKYFATKTLQIPENRCLSIHNSVDPRNFFPGTDEIKRAWRREHELSPKAVVLGSMGRLSYQKDPQTLYRAFARFLAIGADAYLYHVGQGEDRKELEALARALGLTRRLIRTAYFNQPLAFYQVLDGFILTSRYEAGWPLVALEALACDLPIISSTGAGTRDIGDAGLSHCWTAGVSDEEGFSRAISEWYQDRRKNRPSNHRTVVLQRFSPDACFGTLLQQYIEKVGIQTDR